MFKVVSTIISIRIPFFFVLSLMYFLLLSSSAFAAHSCTTFILADGSPPCTTKQFNANCTVAIFPPGPFTGDECVAASFPGQECVQTSTVFNWTGQRCVIHPQCSAPTNLTCTYIDTNTARGSWSTAPGMTFPHNDLLRACPRDFLGNWDPNDPACDSAPLTSSLTQNVNLTNSAFASYKLFVRVENTNAGNKCTAPSIWSAGVACPTPTPPPPTFTN